MDPRFAYVINTFRHLYQVPKEVRIVYGTADDLARANEKQVCVHSKAGRFFEARSKVDPESVLFKKWKEAVIPFLFEQTGEADLIEQRPDGAFIPYDIIASSFYFLSGWQEYVTDRNEYVDGRFPYQKSLQYHLQTADVPWVNYYFDILRSAIEQVYDIELTPQKGNSDFYLAVTHDIDVLFSGWLEEAYAALKKARLAGFSKILADKVGGLDPWFNLGSMYKQVRKQASGATVFFLANTATVDGKKQADYTIDDPRIRNEIELLEQQGAELGVHGSIGSHLDSEMLKHEINQLNATIKGGRFHYLYYDAGATPSVLQESGLTYDSTLGFAEQIGFRNAYAHPFYLYDLSKNRRTDVLEIPLLVMDATLHHRRYMHISPEDSLARIQPILGELRKFNGAGAILWHNSYFSDFKYAGWDQVFTKVLGYCISQKGSAVSASEIVPYYSFKTI